MKKNSEIQIMQENSSIKVNYLVDDIEIEGKIIKYSFDYEFQPSWFADKESENYYSENWEDIEEEVMNHFYDNQAFNHL